MVSDHIRDAMKRQPFEPFVLHLADGREVPVLHPELALVPPKNTRTVFVSDEDGDVEMIDTLLIVSIKPMKPGEKRNGRGKRRKAG